MINLQFSHGMNIVECVGNALDQAKDFHDFVEFKHSGIVVMVSEKGNVFDIVKDFHSHLDQITKMV